MSDHTMNALNAATAVVFFPIAYISLWRLAKEGFGLFVQLIATAISTWLAFMFFNAVLP